MKAASAGGLEERSAAAAAASLRPSPTSTPPPMSTKSNGALCPRGTTSPKRRCGGPRTRTKRPTLSPAFILQTQTSCWAQIVRIMLVHGSSSAAAGTSATSTLMRRRNSARRLLWGLVCRDGGALSTASISASIWSTPRLWRRIRRRWSSASRCSRRP